MTDTLELSVPTIVTTETVAAFAGAVGSTSLSSPTVMIPEGAVSNGRRYPRPPLMIDRDEAYYWTAEWQDGVRDALQALVAGEYRRFDSDDALDLARWLLEDSER
jgi:hypothetical protein